MESGFFISQDIILGVYPLFVRSLFALPSLKCGETANNLHLTSI